MSSLPPIEPGRAPVVTVPREDGASATMFAIRVLAVGVLAAGISLPAFAQTAPATKFTGFLCEIDLKPQANGGVDLHSVCHSGAGRRIGLHFQHAEKLLWQSLRQKHQGHLRSSPSRLDWRQHDDQQSTMPSKWRCL